MTVSRTAIPASMRENQLFTNHTINSRERRKGHTMSGHTEGNRENVRLYHHRTDGGAEYLTDKYIDCQDGSREGIFEGATYIVRIDGDITKDAVLMVRKP